MFTCVLHCKTVEARQRRSRAYLNLSQILHTETADSYRETYWVDSGRKMRGDKAHPFNGVPNHGSVCKMGAGKRVPLKCCALVTVGMLHSAPSIVFRHVILPDSATIGYATERALFIFAV